MNARRRAVALLEVLGVYLAGQLVTAQLIRLLGLRPSNPLASLTAGVTDTQLVTATGQVFGLLLLQYAGWFLLIIPINYWHRRRGPAAYGFTRAGHSWTTLIVAGLATAALCLWPTLAVDLLNAIHPVGETAPWRQALFDTSWRRWQFWLFMAVLSWGFVAVVEEIFFRGYCQRRLAEDWGDGAAIAGITCLFIFSHSQYLTPNAYNAAKILSLLLAALGSGVVFAWTRSLLPSVRSGRSSRAPARSGASHSLWWERATRSRRCELNTWTSPQQAWSYWPWDSKRWIAGGSGNRFAFQCPLDTPWTYNRPTSTA